VASSHTALWQIGEALNTASFDAADVGSVLTMEPSEMFEDVPKTIFKTQVSAGVIAKNDETLTVATISYLDDADGTATPIDYLVLTAQQELGAIPAELSSPGLDAIPTMWLRSNASATTRARSSSVQRRQWGNTTFVQPVAGVE